MFKQFIANLIIFSILFNPIIRAMEDIHETPVNHISRYATENQLRDVTEHSLANKNDIEEERTWLLTERNEPDFDQALALLKKIEDRPQVIKWAFWSQLLPKLCYALAFCPTDVNGAPEKDFFPSGPLWVKGEAVPLVSKYPAARRYIGFYQGVGTFTMYSLSLIMLGLMGAQMYDQIQLEQSFHILPFLRIITKGDESSIRGALSFLAEPQYRDYIYFLFTLPVLYGIGNAATFAKISFKNSPEDFNLSLEILSNFRAPQNRGGLKGLWNDTLRWAFPFLKVSNALNYLLYRLLFDGTLTLDQRESAFQTIILYTRHANGYARIAGLAALEKLAYGTSLKQMDLVEEGKGEDYKECLIKEKALALDELKKQSYKEKKAGTWKSITELYKRTYALYLRWRIGDFESLKTALAIAVYKMGKLTLTVNFGITILVQILGYLTCPYRYHQGVTYAMESARYASSFSAECLQAYFDSFNKIPGQPGETLVEVFKKFDNSLLEIQKKDSTTLFETLDLSGRNVNGAQVGSILKGLQDFLPAAIPTRLILVNNTIGQSLEDMKAFAPYLPVNLIAFDLSYNNNGLSSDNLGYTYLAQSLRSLRQLSQLRLASNYLDDNATLALAESLPFMPNLQHLDLSNNLISGRALANLSYGLASATQLVRLDLPFNFIGLNGHAGFAALGQVFPHLSSLTSLDLSYNAIGDNGTAGVLNFIHNLRYLTGLRELKLTYNSLGSNNLMIMAPLGNSFSFLKDLQYLDLSGNAIGWSKNITEMETFVLGLQSMQKLRYFDISGNVFGLSKRKSVDTLSKGIGTLRSLEYLGVQDNSIGHNCYPPEPCHEIDNLISNVTTLARLTSMYVSQSESYQLTPSEKGRLQEYWNHRNNQTDINSIVWVDDVLRFFEYIPQDTTTISVPGLFRPNNDTALAAFMNRALALPNLRALDLSHCTIFSGHTLFLNELSKLIPLENLNLSNCALPSANIEDFSSALSSLINLRILDISGGFTFINASNSHIFTNALSNLINLEELYMSTFWFDFYDDIILVHLGHILPSLAQLKVLDLSANGMGRVSSAGLSSFLQGLKSLTNLGTLLLNDNFLGLNDTNVKQFAMNLHYIPNTRILDLSGNYIGYNGTEGTALLAKFLPGLKKLAYFQISDNPLVSNLSSRTALYEFSNAIGQLLCQGTVCSTKGTNLDFLPWDNVSSSQGAYYSQQIEKQCAVSQCTGHHITATPQCNFAPINITGFYFPQQLVKRDILLEKVPMTSSGSRLSILGAFRNPHNPLPYPAGYLHQEEHFGLNPQEQVVILENQPLPESYIMPLTGIVLSSSARNMVYMLAPEMVEQAINKLGAPQRLASFVKKASYAGLMIYTTTSSLPAFTGIALNWAGHFVGLSETVSLCLGSVTSMWMSLDDENIPTPSALIASSGGSILGTYLALKVRESVPKEEDQRPTKSVRTKSDSFSVLAMRQTLVTLLLCLMTFMLGQF